MKEHPILFSGAMVRAILDGRKTQTRRVKRGDCCPYGAPGDLLWVRETWRPHNDPDLYTCIQYKADMARVKPTQWDHNQGYWCEEAAGEENEETRWRPSIHMPRWASRIALEIVSVRAERLQSISESDARAEGCPTGHWIIPPSSQIHNTARDNFQELWDSINAARGYSWDSSPLVWVVEFRKMEQVSWAGIRRVAAAAESREAHRGGSW